jgi:hypothetical protein
VRSADGDLEESVNKLIVVATAGVLLAGAAGTASAAGPAWCKDASFGSDDYDLKDLSSKDPRQVIITFAKATCAPTPEAETGSAEIGRARQAWSKKLNMTEADWADAVAYAKSDYRSERFEYSTKDLAAFTPIDQFKAFLDGFSRTGGNAAFDDPFYIADAFDSRLSEVGRYGFIMECLELGGRSVTSIPSVTWALCQVDIDRFDAVKFSDQLRTDTAHGGELRMALRLRLLELPARLKEHAAEIQKLFAKDPAYKKVFEVVAKARTEWLAGAGADGKLGDLALAMDTGALFQSRRAFEGCESKTSAALAAEIAKLPAKTFAGMKDIRMDPYAGFAAAAGPVLMRIPAVSLASMPYILCHAKSGTADFLAAYLQDTPGYRGPRTAAITKVMAEKIELDDLNARIEYPPFSSRPYWRSHGTIGSAGGVVATAKVTEDVLTVELEKTLVKRMECIKSHRTNRISRILPNGDIEYEKICDQSGLVTHDTTWGAFKIRKDHAPLLKKGVMFSSVGGQDKGADVIAIWPNKNADVPSQVLGAVVK